VDSLEASTRTTLLYFFVDSKFDYLYLGQQSVKYVHLQTFVSRN